MREGVPPVYLEVQSEQIGRGLEHQASSATQRRHNRR